MIHSEPLSVRHVTGGDLNEIHITRNEVGLLSLISAELQIESALEV